MLKDVRFEQNLGAQVPLDLTFRDEAGRTVRLRDYFGARPVILTLVYYECPMLCTLELNSLLRALNVLTDDVGERFDILTVSFSPTETPELSARKKRQYLQRYGRPGAEDGWHFLTGDEANIRALTDTVGFHYVYHEKSGEYAHPSGLVILTPTGQVARYLMGIEYAPRDIRLGTAEASANRIGSPVEAMLLLCFHYDPETGTYSLAIVRILNTLCVATAMALGTFMLIMARRERRKADRPDSGFDAEAT